MPIFSTVTSAAVTTPLFINSNGTAYNGSDGKSWQADKSYSAGSWGYDTLYGGSTFTNAVSGTSDPSLYQSYDLFSANTGYKVDLANGTYNVTLKMVEDWATAAGHRMFDVKLEGVNVLTAFDIFASCGKFVACDRTFTANVTDGQLNIQFNMNGGANYATISAIAITAGSGGDTQAPSAPTNLASPSKTDTSVSLSWTASTDNVGVTGYDIYKGTTLAGTSTTTSFTVTGLTASTAYSFTVKAKDAAGNVSAASNALSVTTNAPSSDTTPPSAPTNLTSPSKTDTSVSLSWTASTDNVGVTGYDIFKGTTLAGTSTTTSFTVTGLTASTAYSFTVKAKDAAGNVSAASNAISVTTNAASSGGYKIVAYYPSWATYARNYHVSDIDATKITHINYAFANVSTAGEVVVGDTYADTDKFFPGDCWDAGCKRGNFNQLNKLKASNPHLKTLISVGGWTWSGNFSNAASTDALRTVFADSAVKFVRDWGFDGVDIDWEYPVGGGLQAGRPEDKQNFTLLLQKLREKLNAAGTADGKTYLLTIASSAGPAYVQNTELGTLQQYLNWINIMTYDFHGGWETTSGNNAPLYFDPADPSSNAAALNVEAGVNGHLNAGVPASKLVLGLPFYGRGWGGCTSAGGNYKACTGASSQGTWEGGVFDFSDLQANYINLNGYTRNWNNTAKVPYLYNPSTQVFISYDDVESIGYKTSFLKSKGLAGAMFWELSADRNKTLLTKVSADLPR
ncbi:chitinase [Cohnella luojiensis]|uniref:chitinase n=2 Tax=Cohnella luojiensis TaxID=652876 RepID=A0A4Y8LNJ5_9BACL|nr:chitinase [Cohnella luojiensis]